MWGSGARGAGSASAELLDDSSLIAHDLLPRKSHNTFLCVARISLCLVINKRKKKNPQKSKHGSAFWHCSSKTSVQ